MRITQILADSQRRARRSVAAFRPSEPAEYVDAPLLPDDTSALIACGPDITTLVKLLTVQLVATASEPVLIVPDSRTGSRPNPYAALALLSGLAERGALASIALPATTSAAWRDRWEHLAARVGVLSEPLGDEGWARVSFDRFPSVFDTVDLPLEIVQSGSVIALSNCATPDGCLAIWNDVVHPNSAMRARVGQAAAQAELSLAVQATYLLTGHVGSLRLAVLTQDRIVAELLALGLYRLREEPLGIEAGGPWEAATVQHLVEAGGGASAAAQLTIRTVGPWMSDNLPQPLQRLGELLGCQIERDSA